MHAPVVNIPERFNVATHFVDANIRQGRGGRTAIHCEGRTYTYQDVAEMVNTAGNMLRGLGVEMEQRVMLLLLDSPEFVACFFGAIKIGAVPIPANTLLKPPDYEYMLNDSRARTLIVHEALWPSVEPIRDRLPHLRNIVLVGPPRGGLLSYEALRARASRDLEPADTTKDDVAFWLYSSGSTGFPKGAVHLHHDMVYCVELYAKPILAMREDDLTLSAAKLFFAYGLGNNLYFPFSVGAACVLYPGRPLAEKMFEVVAQYRPTLFFGVPTLYAAMLQVAEAEERTDPAARGLGREPFASVRACVSAGEALPAPLFERWQERFGLEILDGIGSTEVLHIFISNRPGDARPGSSGRIVPGYEARIVDEEGREVPVGEVGNLLIKGDSTAPYYWNKHEKSRQTMLGEWIVTGDKYARDGAGYFTYAGRSDDMLKVGGIWVSPVEVESTLMAHPAVLEAAVVGQMDADQLVKPRAFVVLKTGQPGTPELSQELQAFVKDRIAPYKYPRWLEFVPDLPKTATGKIQRFKLRGG